MSGQYIADICSGYLSYKGFDLHEFLLWNYTAASGLFPYRDIFYPYGLFTYFRNSHLIFFVLNFLIAPLLFTSMFYVFKKIFRDAFLLLLSMSVFYFFVIRIVGIETFSRYGVFVVSTLVFVNIIYKKKIEKSKLFWSGIFLGLAIFIFPDVGFYTVAAFLMILLAKQLMVKAARKRFIGELKLILGGLVISILPSVSFLIYKNGVTLFLDYYMEVSSITQVAKTPFFAFIDSPSNIFTLSILFSSIFFVLYVFVFRRKKIGLPNLFQIALIIDILILEQKSIIRSIDLSITFVSLLLLMLVAYELVGKKIIYSLLIISITSVFAFTVPNRDFSLEKVVKSTSLALSNKCFDSNYQTFLSKNSSYKKVENFLRQRKDFNSRVFSFPRGDSIFYIIFNQKPPFYNASAEGPSVAEQNSTIDYIKENRINYVILNTNTELAVDGVPDFIRHPILFEYILNNYHPIFSTRKHIVLVWDKNRDFFTSEVWSDNREYLDYLLNIKLRKIPYSEGFYKHDNIIKNKLSTKSRSSKGKVIVLVSDRDYDSNSQNTLTIRTKDNLETKISLDSCGKTDKCVINLSRIPLFYKNREIAKIDKDKNFLGSIEIYEIDEKESLFW